MDSPTFWAWIFGFASLASLILAVYVYFKSREYIYPLIEKLRASRNNFIHIQRTVDRIVRVADSKDRTPEDKIGRMRDLARTISENTHVYMNTIDDGVNWGSLSARSIYDGLK